MTDYIRREAAAKREKIKTPFARIIVDENPEKTYYNIMWWQAGMMHVGFGSTNLSFVRKWLSEEFEVDSPAGDVVVERNGRWVNMGGFPACSECGCSPAVCEPKPNNPQGFPEWCYGCGAKMNLEGENDD